MASIVDNGIVGPILTVLFVIRMFGFAKPIIFNPFRKLVLAAFMLSFPLLYVFTGVLFYGIGDPMLLGGTSDAEKLHGTYTEFLVLNFTMTSLYATMLFVFLVMTGMIVMRWVRAALVLFADVYELLPYGVDSHPVIDVRNKLPMK